jgi:hypothetical protein
MALWESFEETCTAETQVVLVLDTDDPQLSDYPLFITGHIVRATRRGMTQPLNIAFNDYSYRDLLGEAVGFMGDDHRPRSTGWDENYLNSLSKMGNTGFVYGNDLVQGERIPTQIAMTTNIPTKLGRMVPDDLHHLYVDDYWKELGRGIAKLTYLSDVIVEHLHPLAGTAEDDDGYRFVNSIEMAKHDARAFRDYKKSGKLQKDIDLLRELL